MKQLIAGLLLLSMVGVASAGQGLDTCGGWHDLSQEWRKFNRQAPHDQWKSGLYMGYIRAYVDFHILELPKGTTYNQMLWSYANYLDKHPELWNSPHLLCFYDNISIHWM